MSYLDSPDVTVEHHSATAVDTLLARHGWQLLDRAAWVEQTAAHLRAGTATDPLRAATYTYSHALYHACSGIEGRARQDLAYGELFRYLYDSAYWRYRDVCDDATHRAHL